jgi:sugar lactone lactonase YvrE
MKKLLFAFLLLPNLVPGTNARAEATSRIYWTQNSGPGIASATSTGADRQVFPGDTYSPYTPWAIALDPFEQKLYWSDAGSQSIRRANLDGTDPELVHQATTSNAILGITLDPFNRKLYWTDHDDNTIRRSNLDGTSMETLYHETTTIKDLRDIAVDPFGGKMYWVNNNTLNWSNLDGSNSQMFVPLAIDFEALSVDLVHRKLYWSVSIVSTQRISRANLDGTNVENVLIGSSIVKPEGLVVDGVAGKMYWTEIDAQRIRRANLDGSQIETILTSVPLGRRITINGSPVPEPTSFALLIGVVLMAATVRRRRVKDKGRRR